MVCLGAVLYITVRALPRIEAISDSEEEKTAFERWAHSELPEKLDAAVNNFALKFLRRAKVVVLRADNAIAKGLHKVQPAENKSNVNIDFKEISGHNTEGKEKRSASHEAKSEAERAAKENKAHEASEGEGVHLG